MKIKFIKSINKNYITLLFFIGFLVSFFINIHLQNKLIKLNFFILQNKEIDKTIFPADSIIGKSLKIISSSVDTSQNNYILFTIPQRACGSCIMSAMDLWFKNYFTKTQKIKTRVILDDVDDAIIGFLEYNKYLESIDIIDNPKFISYIMPNSSNVMVMFVSKDNRIIFAEELSYSNMNRINFLFEKTVNY